MSLYMEVELHLGTLLYTNTRSLRVRLNVVARMSSVLACNFLDFFGISLVAAFGVKKELSKFAKKF